MAQQTFEEIVDAVKQAESRGKRYKDDGKTLTTSAKGALGEMQVMPKTSRDPGFGVTPARDKSPDEIARVGKDYLQAMLGKYGDTEKALIAYNWGPGVTDKWLAAGANPDKLPAETRTYVQRVKTLLGGKDVPRETSVAKKEREPLPPSLPPMAQAQPSPAKTTMAKIDMSSMPASYQAAFALAALADAQDEEDDKVYNENKQTESEKLLAEYKPVNHLASLDLGVTPINFADGGEVDEDKSPEDIKYFSNVDRMKERGTTIDSVMLGARKKAGEGSFLAGLNMANMSKDEKLQTARALMAAYTHQDPQGVGINANVIKPLNPKGPAMANLLGSIPVGEGRVSAGLHGGKAFSLGYNQPIEGGQFNANLNIPRGNPSAAQLNLQYNKRFADGGEVEGRPRSAKSLMEKFKDLTSEYQKDPIAFMRHYKVPTSPMGQGLNAGYAVYKHMTGKDPLLDLQKELDRRLNPDPDTGDAESTPISVGLPPIKRAEGSPKEGERKLDRETMDMLRRQGTSPASLQRVAPPADISSSAAGLPGLMLLADPRIDNTNAYGYVLDSSDDKKNFGMAQAMFLNKSRSEDYPDTIAHETEHLLARQNLGSAASINSKFDELIGNKGTSRLNFVRDAVKAAPYLKEKYDLQSSYLDPKMFEYQSKFGLGKNLLYEQLASLAALEQRHKIDLTKDPELRKTLFSRPDVRETYNALTGLRQTRLDPRDLPPHTRVPEPGMLDAIKGVFKRADGGPVYRADGSPEEGERLTPQQIERIAAQEAAEREAVSTPAFIAQKSGIGRKAGPVSQALQSGQGQIEFLKGMTNVPQNILGAPMDISNMIAGVYGGGVEKPFMGSEYIKEGLRAKGLGFTPSTDPTLAAFYGAGDLGSNLVNPAGVTRAGVQAAGKTGEAARMLAQDFQQYNQQLAVPGASYAVRNKGTPIAMSGLPFKSFVDEAEDAVNAVKVTRQGPLDVMDKPLGDWFSKKLTRYLRSDFATPDDQLVKAAEKGQLLHLAPKDFSDSASDQLLKSFLERKQSDLEYMRQVEGFGNTNMATQPYGQRIEDLTDISAYPERVGDLTPNRVPQGMRDIVETRPETRVTDYAPGMVDNLKLTELRDKMLEVRQSNSLYGAYGQPEVKIPAEFLLPDKTLTDLNVAGASNRMAKYTNWQDNTRQRMATTSLREDPRFTRAPLQDGKYLGVALPDVRQNPEVKQLVLDVGCDGGWCTRYSQNAKAYGSGDSRLHIMVTGEGKKARPVAQFAITDSGADDLSRRFSISEIKEKGNTADFANNPALPAIQEYVQFLDKSYGGLDYVDNLKGLRMTQLPEYPNQVLNFFDPSFTQKMDLGQKFGNVENGLRAVRDKAVDLNNGSRFVVGTDTDMGKRLQEATNLLVPTKQPMTAEEMKAMLQKRINPSKATGGMIERHPDDNRRYM
jgi:hypothetical protein